MWRFSFIFCREESCWNQDSYWCDRYCHSGHRYHQNYHWCFNSTTLIQCNGESVPCWCSTVHCPGFVWFFNEQGVTMLSRLGSRQSSDQLFLCFCTRTGFCHPSFYTISSLIMPRDIVTQTDSRKVTWLWYFSTCLWHCSYFATSASDLYTSLAFSGCLFFIFWWIR